MPYRLTEISGPGRARAEGPDGVRDISTELIDAPTVGSYVIVAYGAALREVPPDEAAELLEILRAIQDPSPPSP
ncbi:MAG: HypC/HybG/HupF family hydrogenase formation chaperone [Armatimonadota bacterium]|nr:HypC/HybG/HupF family hydrogenase formation chaperone [Armatimonadota bacterium]